jgi:fatty-acyl-CoA synthase
MMNISTGDRVLAIVPQFHVLAWGLPYSALLTGAELVLPGPALQPEPLARMIEQTRLNKACGVPTVWQALLTYLETNPGAADISSLREAVVGGSACPPSLMEAYDRLGVTLVQGYGMTETSPLVTIARAPAGLEPAAAWPYRFTQGRFSAGVAARLVDPAGRTLPWDGESTGELELRGPWITASYYAPAQVSVPAAGSAAGDESPADAASAGSPADGGPDADRFRDGWLRTGDVGRISAEGYLTLTDRVKDVIKSGGEWISSVELENRLMAHPALAEASVIGVPDERWGERPFALVVPRPDAKVTLAELREFLCGQLPRWQVPERWQVIDEVPKTSVGKFDKKRLREQYAKGELTAELLPRPEAAL